MNPAEIEKVCDVHGASSKHTYATNTSIVNVPNTMTMKIKAGLKLDCKLEYNMINDFEIPVPVPESVLTVNYTSRIYTPALNFKILFHF